MSRLFIMPGVNADWLTDAAWSVDGERATWAPWAKWPKKPVCHYTKHNRATSAHLLTSHSHVCSVAHSACSVAHSACSIAHELLICSRVAHSACSIAHELLICLLICSRVTHVRAQLLILHAHLLTSYSLCAQLLSFTCNTFDVLRICYASHKNDLT